MARGGPGTGRSGRQPGLLPWAPFPELDAAMAKAAAEEREKQLAKQGSE